MPSPRRARRMDPAKMPPELREFVPVFELYGVVAPRAAGGSGDGGDGEDALREMEAVVQADANCLAELEDFAARFTPEKQAICEQWLSRAGPAEALEAAKVSSFLVMLDALQVDFPAPAPASGTADFVAHALADLQTFDTAEARADRMFAAQSLAERGPAVAARATDALRAATNDPAPEVAAWAHAALALVTGGDQKAHRAAIAKLIDDCDDGSVEQSYAEDALAELDKPQSVRDLGRLCGACILNDLATIHELTLATPAAPAAAAPRGRVDLNARDHSGRTPIEYAVGNAHPEALELLLAAGADANTRDAHGRPVLHDAAARRKGERMIALLLAHGADVNARDAAGATALARAVQSKRDDSARLLREHGGTA